MVSSGFSRAIGKIIEKFDTDGELFSLGPPPYNHGTAFGQSDTHLQKIASHGDGSLFIQEKVIVKITSQD